jgi:hypothetical protein
MDQVDKNTANIDDASDLMKLITHIDIKGHDTERGGGVLMLKKRHMLAFAALVSIISHYYGVCKLSTGASLVFQYGGIAVCAWSIRPDNA